jgi:hypothetical protein
MALRPSARILVLVLALAAGLLVATPVPAQADGFDPAVTVIQPPCRHTPVNADAVGGADGLVHGFVRFGGSGCGERIWYFEGFGDTWTSELSPYSGRVLGVAHDGTGTYLLYEDGRDTRITKRTAAGFTPGRAIARRAASGDVIAADGRWWAVWHTGGSLHQAKTLGTPVGYERLGLSTWGAVSDRVSLAHRPGGGAVLVGDCCYWHEKIIEQPSSVFVAVSADGAWQRRFHLGDPEGLTSYARAQVATSGGLTWLAWDSDRIRVSSNRSGRFAEHPLGLNGLSPGLAASAGRAVVAWTGWLNHHVPWRVLVAEEESDGSWTETWVSPNAGTSQRLAAVAATGGRATVLMMSPTRLYARSRP